MKPLLLLLFITISSFILQAQTFNGTGGAIPGQSTASTCYNNTVSGVGLINSSYGLSQVCININHPYDDELEIILTAPDGTIVPLTVQNGGSGNNYTSTCFSATAVNPIKFGTAPFTGSFLPEGHLGAVNNGQNASGVWKLCIQDRRNSGNAGTLVNWSLTFSSTPAPQPPTLPACTTTLPSTSSCATAGVVCDFNGLCGSTSGSTVQDWPGSGLDGSCFGLQNNSFIKFVASSTSASFSVWVPTTGSTINNGGIQMLFFSGTCNSGAVTTYGCYPHIFPYSTPGKPLITVVSAAGLTPGNTYYLMIDGFNNDNCTFTIAANTGVNILNISPTAPAICIGSNVPLTATGGNGTYNWSPALGLSATSGASVTAGPAVTTTYTVSSSTAASCPITKNVTVTVNPLPAAPLLTASNTCGSSTLTVTGATGTITWSDGGTGNPRTVTTAGTFSVTQTIGSCTSAASNTVTAAPGATPAAPVLIVTNTCGSSTLTVTGATGTLTWSDGGTGNPRTVTTAGTFSVTQTIGSCTSAASNTVTAAPGANPAAPVLTVSNTCGSSTLTVTGATGTLTWSDGGTGNPRTVTTAGTLSVTQTIGSCISAASNIVTAAPGATPAAPVLTVTNTCGSSTLTVTGATGTLTWSDGGTGNPRTVTTAGTFSVTQTIGSCTSAASNTVNAAPGVLPAAPVLTVSNTCGSSTLTVTGAMGTLTWSDGGTGNPRTVTTAGTFSVTQTIGSCTSAASNTVTAAPGATPAAPVLTVSNTCGNSTLTVTGATGTLTWSDGGTGNPRTVTTAGTFSVTQTIGSCTSAASNTVTAAPGANPAAPVLTVSNTCGSSTLTVTGATGTLTWSDGGTGNPRTVTTAGTFSVIQTIGSCTSAASNTVTAAPGATPAAPVLTVSNTCGSSTLTVTGATGTLIWSDGGTGNPRTVTTAGTFSVTQTIGSCTSAASNTVTAAPVATPMLPTATSTQPTCSTTTGSIEVSTPIGANLEYSINGTTYQSSTTFNSVAEGNYYITVRDKTTNCISLALLTIINTATPTPATPTAIVKAQPVCNIPTGTIVVTGPAGNDLEYSLNGGSYQANNVFTGLAGGNYTLVVRYFGSGCLSQPISLNIKPLDPLLCGNDIYFPSAFTPNGDGNNDGFGPGPISNLANVSAYNLSIYNRYGEKVFSSNDPYQKWNGTFKGSLLANYNYVWQASYKIAGNTTKFKKGSISIIK